MKAKTVHDKSHKATTSLSQLLKVSWLKGLLWMSAVCLYSLNMVGQGVIQWLQPTSHQLKLLDISPNSEWVGMGNHEIIYVLDRESGQEVITVPVETGLQYHEHALEFLPDSQSVVFIDESRSLHLFDLTERTTTLLVQGDLSESVRTPIKITPDGQQIAMGSPDTNEVEIRSMSNGDLIETIWAEGATTRQGSIEFNQDGKIMAYAGGGRGNTIFVHIYDLKNKESRRVIETSNTYSTADIALSPDGRLLATGSSKYLDDTGQMVEIWDVETGERKGGITGRSEHLEFMDQGNFLAVLTTPSPEYRDSVHEELQYWRISDMKLMARFSIGHIGNNGSTFQIAPDDTSAVILAWRSKSEVTENGALQSFREGVLSSVSVPVMISSIQNHSRTMLRLHWAGGKGPFELLYRHKGNLGWRVERSGIKNRNATILKPIANDVPAWFFAIRPMN